MEKGAFLIFAGVLIAGAIFVSLSGVLEQVQDERGGGVGLTTIGVRESDERIAEEIAEFEERRGEIELLKAEGKITGRAAEDDGAVAIGILNFIPIFFIVLIVAASVFVSFKRRRLRR